MTYPVAPPPSDAESDADRPSSTGRPAGWDYPGLAFKVYLVAVFLIPLQLEIPAFKAIVDSRLPPGDLFLVMSVMLAPTSVKFRRIPVANLPLGLIVTLAYGMVIALVYAGELTIHSFLVKFIGASVLAVLCLVTVTYARLGLAPRILRVWISGMAFWGLVSYIDWKFLDILPFLEGKIDTRFGGMQFDPNNAGAAYAVAIVVMWQYGTRLYRGPIVRLVIGLALIFFMSQTLSRGGFLGLAAGVAVVLVASRVSANRWVRYFGVAAIVLTAAIGTGFIDNAVNDFERRPDNVGDRNFKLTDSIDQYVESGGLGIGLGTYRAATGTEVVHNTSIWLLTEMSLVGVFFFVGMVVVPAQAALRLRSADFELAMALLGAHVVMIVASVGIEALYQRQWWLIVGLLAQPLTSRPRPLV